MARELRRFDVTFKDYSATYKAGEVVEGTVHLDCGQDVKCKGKGAFITVNLLRS